VKLHFRFHIVRYSVVNKQQKTEFYFDVCTVHLVEFVIQTNKCTTHTHTYICVCVCESVYIYIYIYECIYISFIHSFIH